MQISEAEGNFYDGFQFALLVVDMLPKFDAVVAKLRTVASGEVTLMQSADDMRQMIPGFIREFETRKGSAATEDEKKFIADQLESAIPKNRAEQDARNKYWAEIVLRAKQVEQQRRSS